MIRSFRSSDAAALFEGQRARRLPADIQTRAHVKLLALNATPDLRSLAAIPANRLEVLRGDRAGQYSLRINDQWRICFRWVDGHAEGVEIVDYH